MERVERSILGHLRRLDGVEVHHASIGLSGALVLPVAHSAVQYFRRVGQQASLTDATNVLHRCISMARDVGLGSFHALLLTLEKHFDGIVALCEYRISTGPLEGKNNPFRVLSRCIYSFRNKGFIRLIIYCINLEFNF